jgi:hypothetical protein
MEEERPKGSSHAAQSPESNPRNRSDCCLSLASAIRSASFRRVFAILVTFTVIASWALFGKLVRSELGRDSSSPLRIVPSQLDFGRLAEDGDASAAITLENRGPSTLLITQAAASCGCTTAHLSEPKILPGKTATLVVTVRAEHSKSSIEGQVSISFAEEGKQESSDVGIPVRATIEREFDVVPKSIVFTDAHPSDQQVDFLPVRDKNVGLVGANVDNRAISCRIVSADHQTSGSLPRRLHVTFNRQNWDGVSTAAHIYVKTSNRLHPLKIVRVNFASPLGSVARSANGAPETKKHVVNERNGPVTNPNAG